MSGISSGTRRKAPTAIELSDEIAHQIGIESVRALKFGPKGGVEIGGILLASAWGASTRIDDFRIIPCEHFHGPEYRLSSGDIDLWRELIVKLSPGPLRIIGYWRSTLGGISGPSTDDESVLNDLLPEVSIFIPVRPSASGTCEAGLFLFDSDQPEWTAHPQFELPTEPVPANHAQDEPSRTALEVSPLAGGKLARSLETAATLKEPEPRSGKRFFLTAAAGVASFVCGVLVWQYFGARPSDPPKLSDAAKVELDVAVRPASLRISWGRSNLLGAKLGELLIHDGARERAITLDQVQLETGFVVYTPAADDVLLRLSITDPNSKTIFATARVLTNAAQTRPAGSASVTVGTTPGISSEDSPRLWPAIDNPAGAAMATPAQVWQLIAPNQDLTQPQPLNGLEFPSELGSVQSWPIPITADAIVPPRPLTKVMPSARLKGVPLAGAAEQINVRLAIDETGKVTSASEADGGRQANPFFVARALAAAKSWKFAAAQRDGHPVPSDFLITFNFGGGK